MIRVPKEAWVRIRGKVVGPDGKPMENVQVSPMMRGHGSAPAETTQAGTGATPVPEDMVKVHYTGKFVDGKVFDSSVERNEPATFPLTGVIPCWTEAVQLIKVGGKAQITCPPELAYGEEGRPPQMRGGATLVFDIELLEIVKADAAAAAAGAAPPQ